jgi:hypothetical protein
VAIDWQAGAPISLSSAAACQRRTRGAESYSEPADGFYSSKSRLPRLLDSQESIEICFFTAWLFNPCSAYSLQLADFNSIKLKFMSKMKRKF